MVEAEGVLAAGGAGDVRGSCVLPNEVSLGRRHSRAQGTPLSEGLHANELWCTDYKGEFQLNDRRYCVFRRKKEVLIMRLISWIHLTILAAVVLAASAASPAQVLVSVTVAPPALPAYEQPLCPKEGYIWTAGYWAHGPDGYYWVPGAWVPAPEPGLLWTPGLWAWNNGVYVWKRGLLGSSGRILWWRFCSSRNRKETGSLK